MKFSTNIGVKRYIHRGILLVKFLPTDIKKSCPVHMMVEVGQSFFDK